MAYNEALAARIRKVLARRKSLSEKKMFGGIAFMLRGNMCCGVLKDDLILRLGQQAEEALSEPHTRPFDVTGRKMTGFVMVGPGGYETADDLKDWLRQAAEFTRSLPAK
jgi:TfoX/Sxy family transcriptional regulator of competence genes